MLEQERRRRVVAAMDKERLDALVVYGNYWQADYLAYVTDFNILEGHGLGVVTSDGDFRLFLDSAVEAERATAEISDVRITLVADAAAPKKEIAALKGRIAGAPRPLLPRWLTDPSSGIKLEDGTALVDKLLMFKLPEEIDVIRKAAHIADDGYNVFRSAAIAGRHQYELIADVESFLREIGAPDNFMLMGSGGVDVRAMEPPSERRLAVGDLVTTELTPSIDGYYAQICRTLVVGKASQEQKDAFAVYLEALEAGIAAVKPGARAADVAKAENDVFRKHKLGDYVTSEYTRVRGHGLGLFADSKPHILEDVETVLEPGMTIVVHPNTYNPNAGYIVLGDSLVVTETGCEVFTRTPRELFEVDA
jgi:Xaa-Pro aminopeptidase